MNPHKILLRDGKKVDVMTDAALRIAEKKLGYALTITQGSFNAGGVAASSGTHDGGGVVDLMAWDHDNKIKALRAAGFAAWYRPAIPNLWPAHCHAVLIGHSQLAPSAMRQVTDYLAGKDGLAAGNPDTDPGWTADARFDWDGYLADLGLRDEITDAVKAGRKADRDPIVAALKRLRSRLPRR